MQRIAREEVNHFHKNDSRIGKMKNDTYHLPY